MRRREYVEFGMAVDAYLHGHDSDDVDAAFEAARHDKKGAVAYAKADMKRLRVPPAQRRRLRFRPVFQDFDSGNVSHAGAMWRVYVDGPADAVSAVSRVIDREVGR